MSLLFALLMAAPQEQKKASISDRAVDYVGMRNGPALFGAILEHDGKHARLIAVQREWLRKEQPQQYAKQRRLEIAQQKQVRTKLIERVKAWKKERADDIDLQGYLDKQLEVHQARAEKEPAEPQFMLVELKPGTVRRTRQAKKQNRAVLFVALKEKLANIEIRSAKSIREELKRREIATPTDPVNLSDRVPSRAEDEAHWAARQAIIEHLLRKPVEMRGTPQMVMQETNDGQPVDAQALVAKMMQQQMSSIMQDLLAEPNSKRRDTSKAWLKQTIEAAKKTNSRAAHVMLVIPDATLKAAVVESRFLARMPNGQWQVVWSDRQSIAPKPNPEAEKELLENEQLGGVLNALGAAGQNDAVTKAIRFGVATRHAQQLAQAAYAKWQDPFYDDLSRPAIQFPRASQQRHGAVAK